MKAPSNKGMQQTVGAPVTAAAPPAADAQCWADRDERQVRKGRLGMMPWATLCAVSGAIALLPSVGMAKDCAPSREPPVLEVVVTGVRDARVPGAVVTVAARKGRWEATAATDESGRATFRPQKEGVYRISLRCDVALCGKNGRQQSDVTLHLGSSTSVLLMTDEIVVE